MNIKRAEKVNYYFFDQFNSSQLLPRTLTLTHLPMDKMAAILQTMFSDTFSLS